jgi:hypothetical protein
MNVVKNTVTLKDSWVSSYFDKDSMVFYGIKQTRTLIGILKPDTYDMLTILIFCAKEEISINRVVTTLTDILATAGGFASIILLMTKQVAKIYANTLFHQKVQSKLFKID